MKNAMMKHMIMGVIYCLNNNDSFNFLELSFSVLLPSLSSNDLLVKSFKFLSLFSNISNDSDIILDTSINSQFTLSIFSFALTSLNSFRFLLITFSTQFNHRILTKFGKSPLLVTVDCLDLRLVIYSCSCAVLLLQFGLETVTHFLQEQKC